MLLSRGCQTHTVWNNVKRLRKKRRLWCITEPEVYGGLSKRLNEWGWETALLTDEINCPEHESLLGEYDQWIERRALGAVSRLVNEPAPLLLVQAEIRATNRAAGSGVLLAERIWCERVVPTVIATVDLQLNNRPAVRRAMSNSLQPILSLLKEGHDRSATSWPLALWDLLSEREAFAQAVRLAERVERAEDKEAISSELRRVFLSSQTAFYRHRLKGILASLRILEGAYQHGWLSTADVQTVVTTLKLRHSGENGYPSAIEKLGQKLQAFRPAQRDKPLPSNQVVWICDDAWEEGGWDLLMKPLLGNLFGFSVIGQKSLAELNQHLNGQDLNRVATLLLDVQLADEQVNKTYLNSLHERHPLLDVVLFTSEQREGILIREAYRLGYSVFFKEVDEPARDPRVYAQQFAKTIERSVAAWPIRALSQFGRPDAEETDQDMPVNALRRLLSAWRSYPDPALVFSLVPLFERQFRICYEQTGLPLPRKMQADGSMPERIQWQKAESNLRNKFHRRVATAGTLWMEICPYDRKARNVIAHNPEFVLNADSFLPSLGLALPIVLSVVALQEATSPQSSSQKFRLKVRQDLAAFYEVLRNSNQVRRSEVQKLLQQADGAAHNLEIAKNLFIRLETLALLNLNEKWWRKLVFDNIIEELQRLKNSLALAGPGDPLSVRHWLIFLLLSCLFDRRDAQLI